MKEYIAYKPYCNSDDITIINLFENGKMTKRWNRSSTREKFKLSSREKLLIGKSLEFYRDWVQNRDCMCEISEEEVFALLL